MAAAEMGPSIGIDPYYRLNFERFPQFLAEIQSQDQKQKDLIKGLSLRLIFDPSDEVVAEIMHRSNENETSIASQFLKAVKKPYVAWLSGTRQRRFVNRLSGVLQVPKCEGYIKEMTAYMLKAATCALRKSDGILMEGNGIDHREIQAVVHRVLGIGLPSNDNYAERRDLFNKMKKTGFLVTSYENVEDIFYSAPELMAAYFKAHPHVDTLNFGCGKRHDIDMAFCGWEIDPFSNMERIIPRGEQEHQNSVNVDVDSRFDPDVLANITDPFVWAAIPQGQLSSINNHTRGAVDDLEMPFVTLQAMHRALKPGGYIRFSRARYEHELDLYRQAGFTEFKADFSRMGFDMAVKSA